MLWKPSSSRRKSLCSITGLRRPSASPPLRKPGPHLSCLRNQSEREALAARRPLWDQALEGWNVERSPDTLEWEARGAAGARRDALLELLSVQLKMAVPADVEQRIHQQKDATVLGEWFRKALHLSTADEIRAAFVVPPDHS